MIPYSVDSTVNIGFYKVITAVESKASELQNCFGNSDAFQSVAV